MIGSLIFYCLYPLTRLINCVTEPLKKSPSVSINGKEVWDGEVPSRRFTKTQAALLDLWLSTGSGPPKAKKDPGRVTGEWLKENGALEKEKSKEAEMKKSTVKEVMCSEPETAREEPVLVTLEGGLPGGVKEEVREGKKEAEGRDGVEEDRVRVESPQQQDQEQTILHSEKLKRDDGVHEAPCSPTEESENSNPALELTTETSEVQNPSVKDSRTTEDRAMAHVLLEQIVEKMSMGESGTMAQVQKPKGESQTAAGLDLSSFVDPHASTGEVPAEIWDVGLDLVSLLYEAEAQTQPWKSRAQPPPKGWHFYIGPGLEEVLFCPSRVFPGMSYYPHSLERGAFEVVWRMWEELSETHTAPEPPQSTPSEPRPLFDFTVMSYNILAQDLLEANQELYTHCPLEVLSWDYRFPNLTQEFKKWEPDILCLQEVQENHFTEQLHPVLRDMGYTCVYKRRTGTKTDGCVVCYRGNRFSQVSESLLEFYRPECELLDRDNVGIVLLLQPIITQGSEVTAKGPPLCVATTHLLFNTRRGDVKLTQLAILLAEIDCIVRNCKVKGEHCNVVLCGDFNALPNMPLYQLITTRRLYYHGLPAWMISGQEDLSYNIHHRRVFAPLWPSTVGIDDNCQYTTVNEPKSQVTSTQSPEPGNLQYNHDFLHRLRFCEAACVRPQDLELIPGVTDNTPDPEDKHPYATRFRQTISHNLNLRSAYGHFIPGTDRAEVTTLHSEVGATVDYIFYSPRRGSSGADQKAGGQRQSRGLKLLGRLSLLSEEDLWTMKGLPNEMFPSDHLSLLTRFQLDLNPV
ncbi:protein angel homolog 1 isoform X1 [Coregonus clupeaformis]|uniref:protein angel homolog 1 isoform X1 n=1 Tax=Coregonus clupeaformis TaxID=59861 RepID=UPI001BE0E734|nr:protein angel homolog 1 isoform X1 [Coregonus clupeaformis]